MPANYPQVRYRKMIHTGENEGDYGWKPMYRGLRFANYNSVEQYLLDLRVQQKATDTNRASYNDLKIIWCAGPDNETAANVSPCDVVFYFHVKPKFGRVYLLDFKFPSSYHNRNCVNCTA